MMMPSQQNRITPPSGQAPPRPVRPPLAKVATISSAPKRSTSSRTSGITLNDLIQRNKRNLADPTGTGLLTASDSHVSYHAARTPHPAAASSRSTSRSVAELTRSKWGSLVRLRDRPICDPVTFIAKCDTLKDSELTAARLLIQAAAVCAAPIPTRGSAGKDFIPAANYWLGLLLSVFPSHQLLDCPSLQPRTPNFALVLLTFLVAHKVESLSRSALPPAEREGFRTTFRTCVASLRLADAWVAAERPYGLAAASSSRHTARKRTRPTTSDKPLACVLAERGQLEEAKRVLKGQDPFCARPREGPKADLRDALLRQFPVARGETPAVLSPDGRRALSTARTSLNEMANTAASVPTTPSAHPVTTNPLTPRPSTTSLASTGPRDTDTTLTDATLLRTMVEQNIAADRAGGWQPHGPRTDTAPLRPEALCSVMLRSPYADALSTRRAIRLDSEDLLRTASGTRAPSGAGPDGYDGRAVLLLVRRLPDQLGAVLLAIRDALIWDGDLAPETLRDGTAHDPTDPMAGHATLQAYAALASAFTTARLRAILKDTGSYRPICVASLLCRTVARAAVRREKGPLVSELEARNQYVLSGTPMAVSRCMQAIAARLPEAVGQTVETATTAGLTAVGVTRADLCMYEGGWGLRNDVNHRTTSPMAIACPVGVPLAVVLWDGSNAFNSISQDCIAKAAKHLAAIAPLTTCVALSSSGCPGRSALTVTDSADIRPVRDGPAAAAGEDVMYCDTGTAINIRPASRGVAQGAPENPVIFACAMGVIRDEVLTLLRTGLEAPSEPPLLMNPQSWGPPHQDGVLKRTYELVEWARQTLDLNPAPQVHVGGYWWTAAKATFQAVCRHRAHDGSGPPLTDLQYADDVAPASDALSALAYTAALIIAADKNGLTTNVRKSEIVTTAANHGIVDALFAVLRPDSDYTAARPVAAGLRVGGETAKTWPVRLQGKYLGVPIGDPDNPGVRNTVRASISARLVEPIQRLVEEMQEGASPGTARFLLHQYILPHLECLTVAWGATLPHEYFAPVDAALDNFLSVACPVRQLCDSDLDSYSTDSLLDISMKPTLSPAHRLRAEFALRGAQGGLGIPIARTLAVCRAARVFPKRWLTERLGGQPHFGGVSDLLWTATDEDDAVAADAYSTYLQHLDEAVDQSLLAAGHSDADKQFHKARRATQRLAGSSLCLRAVPWDPDRRLTSNQFVTGVVLQYGDATAQRAIRDALKAHIQRRGHAAEAVLLSALRRVGGPDLRLRLQPHADPLVNPSTATPAAVARAPPACPPSGGVVAPRTSSSAQSARPPGADGLPPRPHRADVQIADSHGRPFLTIDIGVYDNLSRIVANTPAPVPPQPIFDPAAEQKVEKYGRRFAGGFVALIASILGAVTERGRRALFAIASTLVRPFPRRPDVAHRLTVQTKSDIHHILAVGLLQVVDAIYRAGAPGLERLLAARAAFWRNPPDPRDPPATSNAGIANSSSDPDTDTSSSDSDTGVSSSSDSDTDTSSSDSGTDTSSSSRSTPNQSVRVTTAGPTFVHTTATSGLPTSLSSLRPSTVGADTSCAARTILSPQPTASVETQSCVVGLGNPGTTATGSDTPYAPQLLQTQATLEVEASEASNQEYDPDYDWDPGQTGMSV